MKFSFKYFFAVLVSAGMLAACGQQTTAEKEAARGSNATEKGTEKPAEKPYAHADRYWNDLTRFLAGLAPDSGSVLANLEALPVAKNHREFFSNSWKVQEDKYVGPLGKWAADALGEAHTARKQVYYPFSGADFMTVHTIYPNAPHYVLFGLEPEGNVPDIRKMDPARVATNLQNVQRSLNAILAWSFFRTLDMTDDFRRTELNGTLPVLLAFMGRKGNTVLDIYRIKVTPEGKVVKVTDQENIPMKTADGVTTGNEIVFRKGADGPVQRLQYFSVDVSNDGLTKEPGFLAYLESLKPANTYVKSASYLMYKPYFDKIKDLTLAVSTVYVQDDSGMPLSMIDRKVWDLTFYGYYTTPIALFGNYFQQEMSDIYNKQKLAKPLDFGIGYQFRKGTSNLMVAKRK
ncbi:MAG: hypothetical protein KF690_05140 [Bacteroidetes bacterium]|nr:hypothetical protein [Bacteroidota bacterium]